MDFGSVILVNEFDETLGFMEKREAHEKGLLHRAFSVFIFNEKRELLLQRRALDKYHSPGLWSNTCCSHPLPEENILEAAHRRLKEEMGIVCELNEYFSFIYTCEFENGLKENEFDHVFIGVYNDKPFINIDEVCDWKYISIDDLILDVNLSPQNYTYWLKYILKNIKSVKNHLFT